VTSDLCRQLLNRHAAALGRLANFFAKGSGYDPLNGRHPVASGYVSAPRHLPVVLRHELFTAQHFQ
jgi:hypothetical protein